MEVNPVTAALTNAVRRTYGQADGRTDMTQRTGAFHGYAQPPKNLIILRRLTQEKSDIYTQQSKNLTLFWKTWVQMRGQY